ncbi:CoB--CoM heterodisulfide reductase [Desulfonatronospira thiodismutans ASO3-1]|uniref:CoB--CoM heterodisulfide reductase n=1 Tax=Desulfonatronospira thiodismutans ASO3-1 TaxID=555779 RepID=D6SNN9_9BACT|nr:MULTISPECIES: CoB--CoM heterodisulfide reductase iron-sulfur subunit B family protein [Desulfonatronospira]EFI34365.1 CoB--CoM heterodisulfide reductase [Desulfonatronospira thiodismutans ASO3-1]RQD76222.1 MAG: heterodisulfide reductase [Desulfonatronospira sp. MSAO_Bac3]
MQKYGMYLGCNIPFKAPDIEQSFRKVFPALGVELEDLQGASCCPAWGTAPSFDMDTWCAISSRNIVLAEEKELDLMTGCNSCFGVLSEAKHFIEDNPERKKRVNEKLQAIERRFEGSAGVYHVSHVLHEKVGTDRIRQGLTYSLEGLKAAIQPGCHVLWPSDVYQVKEKNPFFPTILKELTQALGAEVPHYSRLEYCCGMGGMRTTDVEKSLGLFTDKILSIKEEIDPDFIVTTCSSCFLQFDMSQPILKERGVIDFTIPVFYYTQVLALALGFDPSHVAAISQTPRDAVIAEIQSEKRKIQK